MPVSQPINFALLKALRHDDAAAFRSALEEERWRWPEDSPSSDYDLLMKAIRMGRKRIVNLLLEKGAEVYKNGSQTSPLHQAVRLVGWSAVVKRLLDLGGKVGVQNGRGDTVLHAAFRCRAPQAVMEMLLQAYAKESRMDKRNRDGLAFVHIASTRDKSKHLREFLEGYATDVNAQVSMSSDSYRGYTALHFAVAFGRYDNAKLLLEYGADINFQDVNGSTPLHLALERRNSKMIDLLFSFDMTMKNIVNVKGLSHFMAACAGTDKNIVDEFLNIAAATKRSPLSALISSRVEDDSSYPLGGYTPLHFAAECGQLETLQGLISSGADPRALTSLKLTPFLLAFGQNRENVCLYMHQFCGHAVDEELFATMCLNVDSQAEVQVVKSESSNVDEPAIDFSSLGDVLNGKPILRPVESDEDELSVVASTCRVVNPVLHSRPTKFEMACELLSI